MAITDLTGYTWTGNITQSFIMPRQTWLINFDCNGETFTMFRSDASGLFYGTQRVFTLSTHLWSDNKYSSFTISGGSDVTNTTLISFLQTYGTLSLPKQVSKVVYGDKTLIDLTADTITADDLRQGVTAHDMAGQPITGTLVVPTPPSGTFEVLQNGTYDVTEYAEVVVNVSGTGGGEYNATATLNPDDSQNVLLVTAGGGGVVLQEKTVNVNQNGTIEVTPDLNYDGLSKVNIVTNIPSEKGKIVGSIAPIEIVKNAYYKGGNDPTYIAYNGWDLTAPLDISDVNYIAYNSDSTTLWGYTYYDYSLTATGRTFTYDGKTFYIFACPNTTVIGLSNTAAKISNVTILKISEFIDSVPDVIIS